MNRHLFRPEVPDALESRLALNTYSLSGTYANLPGSNLLLSGVAEGGDWQSTPAPIFEGAIVHDIKYGGVFSIAGVDKNGAEEVDEITLNYGYLVRGNPNTIKFDYSVISIKGGKETTTTGMCTINYANGHFETGPGGISS